MLKYKRKYGNWTEITFLAYFLFAFGTFLAILGLGQKMPFLIYQILKNLRGGLYMSAHLVSVMVIVRVRLSVGPSLQG